MPDHDVFISYANRDGRAFAEHLRGRLAIEAPHIKVWRDLDDIRGGEDWWKQIQEVIDRSRILVLVVTPAALDAESAPVVKREVRHAREQGVWVYPVIAAPQPPLDLSMLPRWLEKLSLFNFSPTWPDPWDKPPDKKEEKRHDYCFAGQWKKFVNQLDRPDRPARVRNTAPTDLPANYVPRQAELDKLLNVLLIEPTNAARDSISVSASGPGGFGKTTLAKAVCQDLRIQEMFDDGILWVTLGETPDVRNALAKVYEELTGETSAFRDVEQARQRLGLKLECKDLLLVLDDVWQHEHLSPFLDGSPSVVLLVTTRQADLGARAQRLDRKFLSIEVDELPPDLAVEMLVRGLPAGHRPVEAEMEPYRSLAVDRLGRWPLLINLVAGELAYRLGRRESISAALGAVNRGLDGRGVVRFDTPGYRERSAAATIQASLNHLSPIDRDRYVQLAIFPGSQDIPVSTLQALWNLGAEDTERVADEELGRRSLLRFDPVAHTVRLHDVFRKYLVGVLDDPAFLHACLIQGWGDPHHLPDAYAWHHYAYHLRGAGRLEELKQLLLDYRWLRSKLRKTGPIALRNDAANFPDDPDMNLLARAFEQSSHVLAADPHALRGQLYGRLLGVKSQAIERIFEGIRLTQDEGVWLRPDQPMLMSAESPFVRSFQLPLPSAPVAISLTTDGCRAITGSVDGVVRLWDLKCPGEPRVLGSHHRTVRATAVSADGRNAISGASDGQIRLWDLEQPERSRDPWNCSARVCFVALSGDGRLAAAGAEDGKLRVWNSEHADEPPRVLSHPSAKINTAALSIDGRRLLTGAHDGEVRSWDLERMGESRVLGHHTGPVWSVVLSSDGRTSVTTSADHELRAWRLVGAGDSMLRRSYDAIISTMSLSVDGRVITGAEDGEVRLWDVNKSGQYRTLGYHSSKVLASTLPVGENIASTISSDGEVRLWDSRRRSACPSIDGFVNRTFLRAAGLSADGRFALTGSTIGELQLWDLERPGKSRELIRIGSTIVSVALSVDGRRIVVNRGGGELLLWQSERPGGFYVVQPCIGRTVREAMALSDGGHLITASSYGELRFWNLNRASGPIQLGRYAAGFSAAGLSGDSHRLITGAYNGEVWLWNLGRPGRPHVLGTHVAPVVCVAFSADGRLAVTVAGGGEVRVWNLECNQLMCIHHADVGLLGCTFVGNGRTIRMLDMLGGIGHLVLDGLA